MNTLSLCLICKNEEENIRRLLDSVKGPLFDEIIVVDTGSSDRTVEIAKEYTEKVYFFRWINDFSAARNYSFSKATGDFIQWLDSDDIIYPKDYEKLLDLKTRLHGSDIWLLKYEYAHDELGNSICSFYRERIVRRSLGLKWEQPIHEYLPLNGTLKKEDIEIHHFKNHSTSERNVTILKDIVTKDPSNARNVFYLGKELFDAGELEKGRQHLERFTKMPGGWSENKYAAYLKLVKYHQSRRQFSKAKDFCFEAIKLDPLKAEAVCSLGEIGVDEQNHLAAIHWYKVASNMERPSHVLDVIEPKYYTWLPHLQLCLAYNNIGKVKEAALHNEIALSYRSKDLRMLNNKKIFKECLGDDYPYDTVVIVKDIYQAYEQNLVGPEIIKKGVQSAIDVLEKRPINNEKYLKKLGWCVANIKDAGTIRIRALNVCEQLKEIGAHSELCDYETAEKYDHIVVGKSFSEKDFNYIKKWKSLGKKVICDLSEDILNFSLVPDILKICDLVVCCSDKLKEKVLEINENTILIEDALECRI